jgi:hypothetical protein
MVKLALYALEMAPDPRDRSGDKPAAHADPHKGRVSARVMFLNRLCLSVLRPEPFET